MLGGCFDETPPAWSTLAPDSPPSKRSGLTSSDDAPRYRRGSKRKPLPPRTPPGLVQPLRRDLRVAFFPHGKHRGYAATSDIPPSTMLFQERPFTVAGAFSNARDALRETARRVAKDARYKHLSMGDDAGEHRNGDTQSGGRANAPSVDAPEPSPFQDEGIDDLTWNDSLKRVTRNARALRRRARTLAGKAIRARHRPGTIMVAPSQPPRPPAPKAPKTSSSPCSRTPRRATTRARRTRRSARATTWRRCIRCVPYPKGKRSRWRTPRIRCGCPST